MTLTIKHASLTGAAANPDVLVDGPKWDADHTVTGNVDAAQMPALTGDVTMSAGTTGTTLATVNSNVGTFGSATQSVQVTFNAKGLATAASNVTITPAIGSVTGLGTGVATFLTTPSSANLRAALTDEVGTGAAYFVGGALGTPASGTLTNCTGLPLSGHTTQAAYSLVGNFTGSTAAPTASTIGGLTQKASPTSSDLVLVQDQAASGAIKYATLGSLPSSSGVSSIAGNTGAFTLSGLLTNSVNDLRVTAATKSDQETGTSTTTVVTPGNFKNNDAAAKAWVIFAGSSGTVQASFGVTSVSRSGAGQYVITFSTAFASAVNYAGVGTVEHNAANTVVKFGSGANKTTTTITVFVTNYSGTLTDPDYVSCTFFGRQ